MSITTTIEQTADGTGGSPGYTESRVIRRAGRRAQFAFCVYMFDHAHRKMVRTHCNSDGVAFSRRRYVFHALHILWICCHKKLQKDLCLFRASPFASVCVVQYLESKLSDIPRHPNPRLPDARLKSRKYKKPPLAVKKVRLTPVEKMITLFPIRSGI